MRIAVLGAGTAGRTLAARLTELGHEVAVKTGRPVEAMATGRPHTDRHNRLDLMPSRRGGSAALDQHVGVRSDAGVRRDEDWS